MTNMVKKQTVQVKVFGVDGMPRGTVSVEVPLEKDDITGEWCYGPDAIRIIDEIKRQHANIVSPSQVRCIRDRFGMTQEGMCKMLGLGARTWTRWETGAVIPNQAMNRMLLELLNGDYTIAGMVKRESADITWGVAHPKLRQDSVGTVFPFVVNGKQIGNEEDETEYIAAVG